MIVPRLVLDVFRPAAEVLGVVPPPVVEPLEVAAGAESAEPPEVLGAALLPHAAKSATAPAAPAAAHHRLRISISPFGQMFVLPPSSSTYAGPRTFTTDLAELPAAAQSARRWHSQASASG